MSKNNMLYVGVDITSKILDLAVKKDRKWLQTKFANDAKGHTAMVRYLKKRTGKAKVCVEATGIYHLDLS